MAKRKTDQEFTKEVFELVGDEYTFIDRYKNANRPLRVRHNVCGYEWTTSPANFLKGSRCFECHMKSTRKTNEEFLEEVHKEVGSEYKFLEPYKTSKDKLKCLHVTCGHKYDVSPYKFLFYGNRCPKCAGTSSKGERVIEKVLKEMGVNYEREKTFKRLGSFRFDFYLPDHSIAIEYDGKHHFRPNEFWGGDRYLSEIRKNDKIKSEFCKEFGIELLRISFFEFHQIERIVRDFLSKPQTKK